ncbi:hypothetical protein JTE90_015747 [Oedothorax gibbosus]|uniref:BESS domain-containing protein n=1 Tax=Oedothorax gibbosus TaxID=931172 RepID=A0AAV6TRE0_9ARAC|nr:hypothetical protein JTE90_015747 [Oedothorax gibbosus]
MRCLSFLDNYSLARSTYSNFPGNNKGGLSNESLAARERTSTQAAGEGTSTQDTEEGTSTQDEELTPAQDEEWTPTRQTTEPQPKRVCLEKKKNMQKDQFLKDLNDSRAERSAMLKELLNKERDPMDAFFESVTATVKTFPPHLQIRAKRKVTDVILDLEEENLLLKS